MPDRIRIPEAGRDHDELFRTMEGFRKDDADWRDGRTWSLVYYAGQKHHDLIKKASELFFAENALNPMAFRSLKRMEAEVVQMSASMLNGPSTCVGTMTTGGTESVLMAVKAARDRAKAKKPWLLRPEIVAPSTIHVALDKAAHYFGLRVRYVDVGPDFRADPKAMERRINSNTVLICASAPQYPHGVVDPIEEIGAIAEERAIPFHVDACIGGYVLPWVERLGYPVPVFDFRVPGVTSMSADIHKYGFAAKGASVVLYRDMSYLKHQFFVSTDWSGGIYASPSMTGTRAGGPIAAAWASLMGMGEEGFVDHTRRAMEAATKLAAGLRKIPELQVFGEPHATIVSWGASQPTSEGGVNLFAIADRLQAAGWNVDRQQNPPSIHCTVTSNHTAVIDDYLRDVGEAVAYVKAHPELGASGNAAMYGMMAKVPFRALVKKSVLGVMEALYGTSIEPPDPDKIGEADSGPLMKIVNQYGSTIDAVLERVEGARGKFFGKKPGSRS
jgi:glutamate/tyrosine decarboxylase-like PLP-dependent enzyme